MATRTLDSSVLPLWATPDERSLTAWIETQHLTVHFGDRPALLDVSARFGPGETISVLGPNGAGKSTLLRALAGMLEPSHGVVSLMGHPIHRPDRRVVYVPQRSGVDWTFPVSVLDVVQMGQARQGSRWLPLARPLRMAAMDALANVGMDRFSAVQIGQLSGGQQQRVFLARALVQRGHILLLDEPFNGVDLPTQDLLSEILASLRTQGGTVVYATHDLDRAARSSDRVMLVNGRLIAAAAPGEVMTAANLKATFGGQAVVLSDVANDQTLPARAVEEAVPHVSESGE